MRRPAPLARLSASFLLLPALGGCLGGYVYPTATYIPRVPVGQPAADQVHAFRFDIRDYSGSVDLSGGDEYLMHELPLNVRGNVPAQTMVGLGHGWWGVYHTLGYRQRMNPTMRVRLYRRGYETVQVGPWDWHGQVEWKPVDTLAGREKAIDDLISTRETNELYKINPAVWGNARADYNLEAPQTPEQREALLFVATEYDDLAEQSQFHAKEDIARLRDKARQLRELAGGSK
ncbi:MAG: hypothetical protein ACJ8F7_06460 [Gemmataceae bacterium]